MSGSKKISKVAAPPSGLSKGDVVHSIAKSAAGIVPFVGGAISEGLDAAFAAPAEKRLAIWLEALSETVNELIDEVEGLTPEAIGQNEAFVTAVISTTRSAMLTNRKEKLDILRSVLRTVGQGFVLDEVLQNSFLEIVGRYTPEHVALLQRCNDPAFLDERFSYVQAVEPNAVIEEKNYPKHVIIETFVPALIPEVSAEVASELFVDLHRDRLCMGSEGFAAEYRPGLDQPIATNRGEQFLTFVFGAS